MSEVPHDSCAPQRIALPRLDQGALAGRVILITGAHGALGEAASLACARAGATVVLLGRRVPKLNRVFDAVASIGPEPAIYPMDLLGATPQDHADLAARIEAEFGRLDGILHTAAEFRGLTPIENTDPVDFFNALHVNVTAPFLLTRACLPLLRRAPDSAVVFVLDDPSRIGRAYWGGYAVAKHALDGLRKVLADELENSSVRVAALQPGPMHTALRAKAFMNEAPDQWPKASAYAQACVHLLSAAGADQRGKIWSPQPDAQSNPHRSAQTASARNDNHSKAQA